MSHDRKELSKTLYRASPADIAGDFDGSFIKRHRNRTPWSTLGADNLMVPAADLMLLEYMQKTGRHSGELALPAVNALLLRSGRIVAQQTNDSTIFAICIDVDSLLLGAPLKKMQPTHTGRELFKFEIDDAEAFRQLHDIFVFDARTDWKNAWVTAWESPLESFVHEGGKDIITQWNR